MLSKKMQEALNAQINAEYYSSYLYLSMAAYFEGINLRGFGHWMRIQSQEEMIHVMKFFDYLLNRRGRVKLKAVDGPPTSWESPLDAFENVFKHEQHVTSLINDLADLAIAEKDHATHGLLEWFLNEQVEEESVADQIVSELKLLKDSSDGLYLLDKELAARVLATPAGGTA
jgi:ferritin